jgi:uncharacterized protein Smg (DUF494 family)
MASPGREGIQEYIARSMDEVLDDLLGTPVAEAFYAYLLEMGVSRTDLPNKVKLLCSVLDSTYEGGSVTIQRAIARRLFAKLGLEFMPVDGAGLLEYIENLERLSMEKE